IGKGTGAALDFKYFVAGGGMRVGGAVDDFCTVHGQGARIFGIGAFICHHYTEATDFGIDDGPEGIQVTAVPLNPPVINIMRTDRLLNREERGDLVVLQAHFAMGFEDESDIEETYLNLLVPGLC